MQGEIGPAFVFGLAVLLLVAGTVQVAGYFPAAGRPASLRGGLGALLVWLCVAALAALAAAAGWLATARLSWPPAVIAGGLGVVVGPLLFQALPRRRMDRPLGLLIAGLLSLAVAAVLALWLNAAPE